MKLYHVIGYGFPDARAYSYQIARMSNGFLDCGVDTTLVYPASSGEVPWEEVGNTYGVGRVPRRKLLRDSLVRIRGRFRGRRPAFLRISLGLLARQAKSSDVFFGRHPGFDPFAFVLWMRSRRLLRARVFVDLHEARHYSSRFDRDIISGYVVTNELLRGFLRSAGVAPERILLAPHAVDLQTYEHAHRLDRRSLRTELGLADGQSAICYTGQLRASKNVETLIAAMDYLDSRSILFVVGGAIIEHLRRIQEYVDAHQLSHRVKILGQQPSAVVLRLQMAADVLVIPYDSYLFTIMLGSPLKLPEYLATGKPIVAFPAGPLREVLRDDEVVWARDETAPCFAEAIREALTRQPRQFSQIRERMGGWTWADRAKQLASFMGLQQSA